MVRLAMVRIRRFAVSIPLREHSSAQTTSAIASAFVSSSAYCSSPADYTAQDELVYPESISNIFRITDDIYSACTGMPGDVRYQVR